MNRTRGFVVCFVGMIVAVGVASARGEEPSPSPSPSVSDTEEEDATEKGGFDSPDGKFSFVVNREDEYQPSIDLVDAKTQKVLQHIDKREVRSTDYKVLWTPDSKRFALMIRQGHPNQGVDVYFLRRGKFKKVNLPELRADIPKKLLVGKNVAHVSTNHWQVAEKWNKDGSLLITIDHTVDAPEGTVQALRTVLLGFDRTGKVKILKSTVKYDSRNNGEE